MPVLTVVLGSTRPTRTAEPVGRWVAERARTHGGFEVRVADLAEHALPLLDEPEHPRTGRYAHDHTRRWSEVVGASDAFVLVTPEYNHSYPAALKNALDYLSREWADKPVGFVSYGGVSAGTRAVTALKPVVSALRMVPAVEAVQVPNVFAHLGPEGFTAPAGLEQAADAMLDELLRLDTALRPLRAPVGRAA